jgi:hypothetical protein
MTHVEKIPEIPPMAKFVNVLARPPAINKF